LRQNGGNNQNSSGYNSSSSNSGSETFEARFQHRFKTPQFLPPPEPYTDCAKTYPSRSQQQQQQQQSTFYTTDLGGRKENLTFFRPAADDRVLIRQGSVEKFSALYNANDSSAANAAPTFTSLGRPPKRSGGGNVAAATSNYSSLSRPNRQNAVRVTSGGNGYVRQVSGPKGVYGQPSPSPR
jgi:hypothetical protein